MLKLWKSVDFSSFVPKITLKAKRAFTLQWIRSLFSIHCSKVLGYHGYYFHLGVINPHFPIIPLSLIIICCPCQHGLQWPDASGVTACDQKITQSLIHLHYSLLDPYRCIPLTFNGSNSETRLRHPPDSFLSHRSLESPSRLWSVQIFGVRREAGKTKNTEKYGSNLTLTREQNLVGIWECFCPC